MHKIIFQGMEFFYETVKHFSLTQVMLTAHESVSFNKIRTPDTHAVSMV